MYKYKAVMNLYTNYFFVNVQNPITIKVKRKYCRFSAKATNELVVKTMSTTCYNLS